MYFSIVFKINQNEKRDKFRIHRLAYAEQNTVM